MSAKHPSRRFARYAIVGAAWAGCVLLSGATRDPEFLQFDAAARRVDLLVVAAYTKVNSGFNFNGGWNGSHRVTIPLGWTVRIAFENRDVIPHSVGLVREERRLPTRVVHPSLPGAASRALEQGIPAGARQDDIVFVASGAGTYLLACGVPGHTAVGSYLRVTISPDATVPSYEIGLANQPAATRR
jgi:sulfocyanin